MPDHEHGIITTVGVPGAAAWRRGIGTMVLIMAAALRAGDPPPPKMMMAFTLNERGLKSLEYADHTYYGDPRIIPWIAPEMHFRGAQERTTIYAYFKVFDYAVTAAEYRHLHQRYPDVLLIPEWEQPLHYAITAPLQSFFHHGVTATPPSVRDLYPRAFIVNMMDNLPQMNDDILQTIRASVRAGDVPMVNGWYIHAGTEAVRKLYQNPSE